jgi:hypothetical protein
VRWLFVVAILLASCDPDAFAPGADRARATERRAHELAAHLETLPGITAAHVILDIPIADPLAPTSASASASASASPGLRPRASITLALQPGADATAAEAAARRAALATVDGLTADAIAISTSAPPAEKLVAVGPFRVAEDSRIPLIAALALGLLTIAALASWIALAGYRRATRPQ